MFTRLRNAVYMKNLTLIFLLDIKPTYLEETYLNQTDKQCYSVCLDPKEIAAFYISTGRKDFTVEVAQDFLQRGYECHCCKINGKIVASCWNAKNNFNIDALSFRALKARKNDTVNFEQDTLYLAMIMVDPQYRGKHIYTNLAQWLLKYYQNSNYRRILFITGASSSQMIHWSNKLQAKLISIVKTSRILYFFTKRKEYFHDKQYICWTSR